MKFKHMSPRERRRHLLRHFLRPRPGRSLRGWLTWLLLGGLYVVLIVAGLLLDWPERIVRWVQRGRLRWSPAALAVFVFEGESFGLLEAADELLYRLTASYAERTGASELLFCDVLADDLDDVARRRALFDLVDRREIDETRFALREQDPARPLTIVCLRFVPARLAARLDRSARAGVLGEYYAGLLTIDRDFAERAGLLMPLPLTKFKEWREYRPEGWHRVLV